MTLLISTLEGFRAAATFARVATLISPLAEPVNIVRAKRGLFSLALRTLRYPCIGKESEQWRGPFERVVDRLNSQGLQGPQGLLLKRQIVKALRLQQSWKKNSDKSIETLHHAQAWDNEHQKHHVALEAWDMPELRSSSRF